MQSLVQYQSSDEEDADEADQPPTHDNGIQTRMSRATSNNGVVKPSLGSPEVKRGSAQGPILESATAPAGSVPDAPWQEHDSETMTRRIMQNLTLPPVPHIDIPQSPPESPDPAMTERMQRFLALKAQGVHLNETLASKPALRNPSMFGNLMDFAGIGERESWASSLPPELQVGGLDGFDESQYVENLELERNKRNESSSKARDKVDFTKEKKGQLAGIKRTRK